MMPIRLSIPRLTFAAACFALLLLAGCARTEAPFASPEDASRAAELQTLAAARDQLVAQQASFTPVKAKWTLGDTISVVTGYYQGDTLRTIDEQMNMGEYGAASVSFTYNPAGKLFAYRETKQARSGTASGTVRTEQSELQLYFAESGALISGQRLVDGKPAALMGMEEQTVRMHARELEASLAEARAKQP